MAKLCPILSNMTQTLYDGEYLVQQNNPDNIVLGLQSISNEAKRLRSSLDKEYAEVLAIVEGAQEFSDFSSLLNEQLDILREEYQFNTHEKRTEADAESYGFNQQIAALENAYLVQQQHTIGALERELFSYVERMQ